MDHLGETENDKSRVVDRLYSFEILAQHQHIEDVVYSQKEIREEKGWL